jgi:HJR/Mrr/RecB family endonuclease
MAETLLPLALVLMMALGLTWVFGPVMVHYSGYRKTRVFQCKKALRKTLRLLQAVRRAKQQDKTRLASDLWKLNEQMLQAAVHSALGRLPISQVTDAKGIGEKGAILLAQHGFRTVRDLKGRLASISMIDGFGDYRTSHLGTWLSETEHRLRKRAETDPRFEVEITSRYRKQIEPLRDRISALEQDIAALKRGLERVQKELQRYQQIGFFSYLRGQLLVKSGDLELPTEKPAEFSELRGPDRIERKSLPIHLLESLRFHSSLQQHLQVGFQDMEPRDFEEFVAKLLERLGYSDIRLTSHTQDYGADIVCADREEQSTIVEVKRYDVGNKIGNRRIRDLIGALDYYSAEHAIFVTTSDYTPEARKQAESSESIELWSGEDLEKRIGQAFPSQDSVAEVLESLESWASGDILFRLREERTGFPALLYNEGIIVIRDKDMLRCPWVSGISVTRGHDQIGLKWPGLNTLTLETADADKVADMIQERTIILEEGTRKEFQERFEKIVREYGDGYLWASYGVSALGVIPICAYEDRIAWTDDRGTHTLNLRNVTFAAAAGDHALIIGSAETISTLPIVDPQTAAEWLSVSAVSRRISWGASEGEETHRKAPLRTVAASGVTGIVSCCAAIGIAAMLVRGNSSPQRTPAVVATETSLTATLTSTVAWTATSTAVPSRTSEPTETRIPTAHVSDCVLAASFQADVTIPDDSRIEVGQTFTKTWRIRNTGTCDWGPGYHLTYINGDRMKGSISVDVPETAPGESVDVSVVLVVPDSEGQYRGHWRLCVNETEFFGDEMYVQIVAYEPASTPVPTSIHAGEPTETLEPTLESTLESTRTPPVSP